MISITCTSCQNVLSIDDAFAGGVCRCQHCGTIQTVPARRKDNAARATVKATEGQSSKAIYKNESRTAVAAGSGSGLDDLAGIVASSGLSDGQLRKRTATARPKNWILPVIIGGILALLIVAVVYMILQHKPNTGSTAGPAAGPNALAPSGPGEATGDADHSAPANTAQKSTAGPNCFGVKLSADTVVYLIDNGSSARESLDSIKAGVFRSVESLGADHHFQILFWDPNTAAYPTTGHAVPAIPGNIDEARKLLDDIAAVGSTDPGESLKKALGATPGEIVLITTKGYEMDDSALEAVMKIRGTSSVKIDTIAINGAPPDSVLRKIAEQTGGVFAAVSAEQLKTASD